MNDAMSEALLHRHNPGRAQLTDRAREFRGLTLLELARHALDWRGIATRGMSKMELATEALIGRSGLHSTSDFPLILANVANKTLRAAYDTTPRTFTAWARQAVITDFKPVARNQLGGAPDDKAFAFDVAGAKAFASLEAMAAAGRDDDKHRNGEDEIVAKEKGFS